MALNHGCLSTFIAAGTLAENERRSDYNNYFLATQQLNTEREEHNLKPFPVLTFNEWLNTNGPTSSVQHIQR